MKHYLLLFFCFSLVTNAQVGIGTLTPNSSSALEVKSSTGGILIPRMTATEVLAITEPAQGLLVFANNTSGIITSIGFWYYDGNTWTKIGGNSTIAISNGGTGATTANDALNNLGAQSINNLSNDINTDTGSIVKYPSVDAIESYVGSQIIANTIPDATTSVKGKIVLAGDLTNTADLPRIANGAIDNSKISSTAAIDDSKLATIATSGKVSNSATTATASNTNNTIVLRDASGNFTAGTITSNVSGTATNATNTAITNDIVTASSVYPTFVTADTGNLPQKVSSTKLSFVPSTGTLTATKFNGDGSSLTGITASTNANLTGAITSTGNSTSLGSFTSANLSGALTDETGTGSAVMANSPTLVTPNLGTPSALTGTNISGTAANLTAGTATNATNTSITDDITTATSVYPTFVTTTTGNLPQKVSSTKLSFVPSTGILTATKFVGDGSSLTGITASTNANLTGAITSTGNSTSLGTFTSANLSGALSDETGSGVAVMANSPTLVTPNLGTPSALTGTNISGTAANLTAGNATNTAITNDIVTASSVYPTFVTADTGNLPQKVSSTKLSFVPSTGTLTATKFVGDGSSLTNNVVTTSSNYTLTTANSTVLCNALSASITLTLPVASTCTGRIYCIRKTDESYNTLNFSPSIYITDTTTFSSLNYSKTIRIQSNGTNWYQID